MTTQISEGIRISVITQYQPKYSSAEECIFLFSYRIRIENISDNVVQLISRHWHIFDSSGGYSEVKGDGVIGIKPILNPGDYHEYDSTCSLFTEIGKMHGIYTMLNKETNKIFTVEIPSFELATPFKLN